MMSASRQTVGLAHHNWISGTLELTSKVRYGITSRGVPIFRFIPYDKRFSPFAVGCSQRNLFYNIHAIVEPSSDSQQQEKGLMQKANLVQNLGIPSDQTELQVIIAAYAYDSCKSQRSFPTYELPTPQTKTRPFLEGFTFHIDPPGCKDVDDSFTISYNTNEDIWNIAINIADVSELVQEDSVLDLVAKERSTSFYNPTGAVLYPMLPQEISEGMASLLPGSEAKPTLSLCFTYSEKSREILTKPSWKLTQTLTTASYTYEEANKCLKDIKELQILSSFAKAPDSHEWVENMMIFYNKHAGEILAKHGTGILRRHSESSADTGVIVIPEIPEFLTYEAAEYCLPTDENIRHFGLDSEFYAYASSPIRRYADLVNQRAIKKIIEGLPSSPSAQVLIDDLNRRQKQAKAFSRDLFFMTNLSSYKDQDQNKLIHGIVVSHILEAEAEEKAKAKAKAKIWVPEWKRMITSKGLVTNQYPLLQQPGTKVSIQWYECHQEARWKEKIVFKINSN